MSSTQYDNERRGVLFKNHKKEKESDPDYKGEAQVEQREYWLAAWRRKSAKGETFMKLSFQPKQQQQPTETGAAVGVPVQPTADENIPF